MGKDKSGYRRIFEGQIQFNDFELKQIKLIDEKFQKSNKNLIDWWDNPKKLRFLYANKFHLQKTFDSMIIHQDWRTSSLPPVLSKDAEQLLNNGAIYLHGHDNRFRPIIIIDVNQLKKDIELNVIFNCMSYFLEYVMKYALIDGQVENWVVILDLKQKGATQLPVGNLKGLMGFLSNNYRSRMYKCYVLNTVWTINGVWSMVKGFLNEKTIEKIIFDKTSKPKGLLQHVNPEQLEEQYGGIQKKIEKNFWPPKKISNNWQVSNNGDEKILISQQEYTKLVLDKTLFKNVINLEIIQSQFQSLQLQICTESKKEIQEKNQEKLAENLRNNHIFIDQMQKIEQIQDKIQQNNILGLILRMEC